MFIVYIISYAITIFISYTEKKIYKKKPAFEEILNKKQNKKNKTEIHIHGAHAHIFVSIDKVMIKKKKKRKWQEKLLEASIVLICSFCILFLFIFK